VGCHLRSLWPIQGDAAKASLRAGADVRNLIKIRRVIKDGKVFVPDKLMRSIAPSRGSS
jgi:hypothetical protein